MVPSERAGTVEADVGLGRIGELESVPSPVIGYLAVVFLLVGHDDFFQLC